MDLADETQIMSDIEGRIPDAAEKMVYSFLDKQTGREVVGLSWRGTKEAQREFNKRNLAKITITDKAIISQHEGGVDVAVYAYDEKRKIGGWGMAGQSRTMRRRTGEKIEDPHASAKAMSKAQRNAINNLLPAEKIAKMINAWVKKGNVQQIEAPAQGTLEKPETSQVDWVSKLKVELFKRGAKTELQALAILKRKTGLVVKDFNITQKNAQMAYILLIEPKK